MFHIHECVYKEIHSQMLHHFKMDQVDLSSSGACDSLGWQPRRIVFIFMFLYICFCVSCFVIPDSISLGMQLCFAYTFSMIQLIEVTGLMRGESQRSALLMCVTLVTGTVMPTMQILSVMEGWQSVTMADIFGYVYMIKEVVVQVVIKDNTSRVPGITRVHAMLVVGLWVFSETVFRIFGGSIVSDEGPIDKIVYIVRMSPHFYMTFISITRIN